MIEQAGGISPLAFFVRAWPSCGAPVAFWEVFCARGGIWAAFLYRKPLEVPHMPQKSPRSVTSTRDLLAVIYANA